MGKSQEFLVGYQYFLGAHIVPCMAPIDGISEIWFNDRRAWVGSPGQQSITVNAFGLFGGKEREGGVAGYIDYHHGEAARGPEPLGDGVPLYAPADQLPNEYLKQVLYEGVWNPATQASYLNSVSPDYNPALVSAFRGATGMVFRRFYWGNNPYLKPMRLKAQNVLSTFPDYDSLYSPPTLNRKGSWLPQLAPICQTYEQDNVAIYVLFDNTGSFSSPEDKAALRDQAIYAWLETLRSAGTNVALRIQEIRNAVAGSSFEAIPMTTSDVDGAIAWVEARAAPSGLTAFSAALASAPQFFADAQTALVGAIAPNTDYEPAAAGTAEDRVEDIGIVPGIRKIILFMSDGDPTVGNYQDGLDELAEVEGYEFYGIAIGQIGDLRYMDNTPGDGIPVITEDNLDGMAVALSTPFRTWADLNAAHILRDIHLNPVFGGSGDPDDIGASYATAAQTFFDEGMGLSFQFQNSRDRDGIVKTVQDHAGCITYRDPVTDKWEIKPIRPDYDLETLFTFDSSIIEEWLENEKPQANELPNHITLVYTNRENGEEAAISAANNAAIQVVGRVVPEKVELPGITCPALAAKVLQREVQARTQAWRRGRFRAAYRPSGLNLGEPFLLNEPRLGISNEVCRIVEIEETDGKDNSIVITFAEDVFQYGLTAAESLGGAGTDDATTGRPTAVAQPSSTIFFEEAAYFDQVNRRGQSDTDQFLTDDADAGNWHITGDAFDRFHVSADIARNDGASWTNAGIAQLMPVWTLTSALGKNAATATSFTVQRNGREQELRAGQIIQIGTERMRLDSVVVSGANATFNVGRGILDTVPQAHASGAKVIAWYPHSSSDGVTYTAGDEIDVRLLPKVFSGDTVNINDATTQSLTMNSRAIRPYPVAQLRVDGEYTPQDTKSGTVSVTWVHRDRLLQTSAAILDHTDAGVGPESGVEYHLVRRWIESVSGVEVVGHEIETALSPDQTTSTTVDLAASDMLAYQTPDTFAMEIGIRSKRIVGSVTYENWQTPFVRVFVAGILAAPFNLTGEAI